MGGADRASQLVLAGSVDDGLDYFRGFYLERKFEGRGVLGGHIALIPHGLHEIYEQRCSFWTGKSRHVLPLSKRDLPEGRTQAGRKRILRTLRIGIRLLGVVGFLPQQASSLGIPFARNDGCGRASMAVLRLDVNRCELSLRQLYVEKLRKGWSELSHVDDVEIAIFGDAFALNHEG